MLTWPNIFANEVHDYDVSLMAPCSVFLLSS